MPVLPFLLIPAAGVAVVGAAGGGTPLGAPPPTETTSGGGVKGTGASAPGSTITDQLSQNGIVPIGSSSGLTRARSLLVQFADAPTLTSDRAPNVSPNDAETQSKLDTIKQYGEAAYNKLSAAAKKASAKAMNEEFHLDPPLDGTESWATILKRVEPYAAAKAGAAIGEVFGGPAGAALGEVVGKYLGTKLETLLSGNVDSIKAWFRSKWGDIESWIEGKASAAVDTVESWFDDIF